MSNESINMSLQNVCLVLDMDGFQISKKFYVRELGFNCIQKNESGSYRFDLTTLFADITQQDWKCINYVKYKVHGLSLRPLFREKVYNLSELDRLVRDLYARSKTQDKTIIAYKGGMIERDLLNRLNIPCLNIEQFGCPKFEKLPKTKVPDCGYHVVLRKDIHCPVQETAAFAEWIRCNQ